MRRLPAAVLLCALATLSRAQDLPVVRVDVSPDEVAVGKAARVRVTVLVPTWFPKPPVFPNLELANAITRLPPDSARPTTERVGGSNWSGIVRNYQVYPLTAATYRLSDATMRVTWANPGSAPHVAEVAVPEISLRGTVPAGAEELDPYVAGTRLTLRRDIEGDVDNLEAGDAVVVRYIAELEGLPAIFIPPLGPPQEAAGVSIYADEPVVEEGEVALRSETYTLVFEAGGEYTLPERVLEWWNIEAQRIEQAALPAVAFAVAGPAPTIGATQGTVASLPWRAVIAAALLLTFIVLLARRHGAQVLRWQRRRAELARLGEAFAFGQLRRSAAASDPRAFYAAMVEWVTRLQPNMDVREFAARSGNPDLLRQTDQLARSLYGGAQEPIDLRQLRQQLGRARARWLNARRRGARAAVPPLNPTGPGEAAP